MLEEMDGGLPLIARFLSRSPVRLGGIAKHAVRTWQLSGGGSQVRLHRWTDV